MKGAAAFERSGRWRRAPLPSVREPFINIRLLPLGKGRDGRNRFWTSTHNMVRGSTGMVIDEDGNFRRYPFGIPIWHLPAAVAEGSDVLWLCRTLQELYRLTLSTGRIERFPTGAPLARVGQGPAYDAATGKLLLAGGLEGQAIVLSFDTRSCRPCRQYPSRPGASVMRFSFPNGDGTWSMVMTTPGQELLLWDPRKETLAVRPLTDHFHVFAPLTARLISDSAGRWYIPECGWYEPQTGRFSRRGPRPPREMVWFARQGANVWGVEDRNGSIAIYRWETDCGALRFLCEIPDAQIFGCELTPRGKIVVMNVYGCFYRLDAATGAIECSRLLPAETVPYVDTLCRVDADRIVGSAFITQRFWELDLRTGEGKDCGRVAPGWGEAVKSWRVGSSVFMAIYTGGELVQFIPGQPARFPENPRVVVRPPRGQRPVAAAVYGQFLFYGCTRPYPEPGGVLTRFHTGIGTACFLEDPFPGEAIVGLAGWNRGLLLVGTSRHTDHRMGKPGSPFCHLALLNGKTMQWERKQRMPKGVDTVTIAGALGANHFLCSWTGENGIHWITVDATTLAWEPYSLCSLPARGSNALVSTGRTGHFFVYGGDRVELWDLGRGRLLGTLAPMRGSGTYISRVFADDNSVILVTPEEVLVREVTLR